MPNKHAQKILEIQEQLAAFNVRMNELNSEIDSTVKALKEENNSIPDLEMGRYKARLTTSVGRDGEGHGLVLEFKDDNRNVFSIRGAHFIEFVQWIREWGTTNESLTDEDMSLFIEKEMLDDGKKRQKK